MVTRGQEANCGREAELSAWSIARHLTVSTLAALDRAMGCKLHLQKNRVQFIYLRHLFRHEESSFRRILRALGHDHCFVSYSDAVAKVRSGVIDRPYISISFDDGLKNCMRAARILDKFGVPACFFICPALVGEKDPQKLKGICTKRVAMPPTELMSWGDIDTLLKGGHEIGSHTMTHPVLAQIPEQQMRDEIAESYAALSNRVGKVKHFAWPEGRFSHFSPAAARAVFDTGFESCASAERGCHITRSEQRRDAFCLRRDYIVANWPLSHILYFLSRNSQRASTRGNRWPEGWLAAIQQPA